MKPFLCKTESGSWLRNVSLCSIFVDVLRLHGWCNPSSLCGFAPGPSPTPPFDRDAGSPHHPQNNQKCPQKSPNGPPGGGNKCLANWHHPKSGDGSPETKWASAPLSGLGRPGRIQVPWSTWLPGNDSSSQWHPHPGCFLGWGWGVRAGTRNLDARGSQLPARPRAPHPGHSQQATASGGRAEAGAVSGSQRCP